MPNFRHTCPFLSASYPSLFLTNFSNAIFIGESYAWLSIERSTFEIFQGANNNAVRWLEKEKERKKKKENEKKEERKQKRERDNAQGLVHGKRFRIESFCFASTLGEPSPRISRPRTIIETATALSHSSRDQGARQGYEVHAVPSKRSMNYLSGTNKMKGEEGERTGQ